MLFKLETRERLGRHTHESLLSFPTKGNQFSSLKEPVRYCVSSALRPSAYARLRHHKSIFDEWTLSFPLFLFILIYLYRFWLVFSLYLLRENGAFSLLFRSSLTVPCGWLCGSSFCCPVIGNLRHREKSKHSATPLMYRWRHQLSLKNNTGPLCWIITPCTLSTGE